MNKRLLYITSSFDADTHLTPQEYRDKRPFGHAQVLYHLADFGWTIRRLSFNDTKNLTKLARLMADYQADIVFTNGSTALTPVWARKLTRKWSGPIVCGWDDFCEVIWDTNFNWLAEQFMRWFELRFWVQRRLFVRGHGYGTSVLSRGAVVASDWCVYSRSGVLQNPDQGACEDFHASSTVRFAKAL